MARATQMLAYHGRTALLLGPMPRRAIPLAANTQDPVRPLADISDFARNSALKAATGLDNPLHKLLETAISPMTATAPSCNVFPALTLVGPTSPGPQRGQRRLV